MRKYIVFYFSMVICAMTFAQLPLPEIEALRDFYDATGGPTWNSETDASPLNDWIFATPLSATVVSNDWYGVTLNAAGTNVDGISMNPTGLTADRNNLIGTLPASISNLSELRTLNLEIEELSGAIPTSITALVNLTTLNLRSNDFSGVMPIDIDNLASLTVLRLSANELTGTIPNSITNLANLQYLDLRGNRLSGTIPFDITNMITLRFLRLGVNEFTGVLYPEFSNLINLIELGLGNNLLTGGVPPEYGTLLNLRLLNLSFNTLTGSLPVSYRNLVNLEIFNLSSNNLVGILPPEYSEMTGLRILNLGANDFTGTIPFSFSNLTTLTFFDVASNNLSGDLAPEFSNWVNIRTLNLTENQFTGNIPEAYASFTNLVEFSAANNLMQGTLSPLFSVWTSLRFFWVQNNNFSGILPAQYSQWAALTNLNISNNDFEGAFPDLSAQVGLSDIVMNDNNFQFGDFEDEFTAYDASGIIITSPQANVDLTENRTVNTGETTTLNVNVSGTQNTYQWFKNGVALVDNGRVVGSQTATLTINPIDSSDGGVYTSEVNSNIVTGLSIERNPITVSVMGNCDIVDRAALMALYNSTDGPNWTVNTNWGSALPIGQWHGVTTNGSGCVTQLLLSTPASEGNNLVGTIPDELGNLTSLVDLDLSNQTNLNGAIPDSFGALTNLEILLLHENNLSGIIPSSLGNLSQLESLWLSSNMLNGTIPPSLGALSNLSSLLLSSNELTGPIPTDLGNLTNLITLWLSGNRLTGEIPQEIGALINLRSLLLNNNRLTGELPETIYDLVNLEDLYLNNNQLSGFLSTRIDNLVSLESLTVTNNLFSGVLPSEMGNLPNLSFLGLASNLFTGSIPPSFSNLVNLSSFNIANNAISGVLPPDLVLWTNIGNIDISNNQLEGDIPNFIFNPPSTKIFRFNGNRFQFGDFENEFNYYNGFIFFDDDPQALVNNIENFSICAGSTITLETMASGTANIYEWFKDGVPIPSSNTPNFTIANLQTTDNAVYTCTIRSTIVTDLILERNPITLTVNNTGPTANEIENLYVCDTDTDGLETFSIDLTAIAAQVLGGQTGLTVSYFDTQGNPLVFTGTYTNTIANREDITVRVEATAGCSDETTFSLVVHPLASADAFSNRDICIGDTYILEPLSVNNEYFTGSGKTGRRLNEGDVITETQTIYVYAETGTASNACTSESSFSITVNGSAADNFEDVVVCTSYVLPNLSQGNSYHTMPNGGGMILNAGDEVLQTQAIYIQSESNGCFNETNFMVTVDAVICQDGDSLELQKYFTPNNDGFSDFWDTSKLAGTGTIRIFIFDRYGKLIQQLNPDSNAAWDGFYNGSPMPSADYWFQYVDSDSGKRLTGHFTLKR